jgi:hypothetical protein
VALEVLDGAAAHPAPPPAPPIQGLWQTADLPNRGVSSFEEVTR